MQLIVNPDDSPGSRPGAGRVAAAIQTATNNKKIMLKNYFKITFRNLRQRKFYTFINVSGLTIGLAASLLIAWYVIDELSYDRFHRDVDRAFRVVTYADEYRQLATTPPPLYDAIKNSIPEVETVARAFSWNHSTMRLPLEEGNSQQTVFRETEIFIVDPEFLQVLDFNLIAGEVATALKAPNSLVLTQETAERYFGTGAVERGEVLGKTILFGGNQSPRQVTGVVAPSGPTHFPFDMLVNINYGYREIADIGEWNWHIMHTYVKVRPGVQDNPQKMQALTRKLDQIAEQYAMPYMEAHESESSNVLQYQLQPVTDIHLHSNLLREHQANGSIMTVYTLTIVAGLIVLLACINFMNLSTAQATPRAKEVGIRKVLGSPRKHLILQFLSESIIISLLAMLLALGLVEALRMPFNSLVGKHLYFDWLSHPGLLLFIGLVVVIVGLLAGSYPAFYLSGFRPVAALQGKTGSPRGVIRLRNPLIIFQFVVSISLIIATTFVVRQLRFIQTKDIGYNRENVLIIKNDKEIEDRWKDFKEILKQQSQIQQVSFATGVPSQPLTTMRDIRVAGDEVGMGMRWLLIDADYIATLGLTITEGRGFREDIASDQQQGLLLNEAAVKALALENPVGKTIIKNKGEEDEEHLQVLGVIKDFNVESFDRTVKPMVFQYFTPSYLSDYVAVRLHAGNVSSGVEQVSDTWAQFESENPLVYSFLDQDFDRLFRAEQQLGNVLKVFTALAILVACLGLFGLVAFVTAQRTKEIGIRKVLGASVSQISHLISKDFLKLIIIAFVVAAPLSYWAIEQWLNRFAYRTEIGVGVFIIAGLTALLIAWCTISFQAIKAALANPVDSLRSE